jgi:hypothetical protein
MRREAGILTNAVSCGAAAHGDARLAQVWSMAGNFPGQLAIENDEDYIWRGLPCDQRLKTKVKKEKGNK